MEQVEQRLLHRGHRRVAAGDGNGVVPEEEIALHVAVAEGAEAVLELARRARGDAGVDRHAFGNDAVEAQRPRAAEVGGREQHVGQRGRRQRRPPVAIGQRVAAPAQGDHLPRPAPAVQLTHHARPRLRGELRHRRQVERRLRPEKLHDIIEPHPPIHLR